MATRTATRGQRHLSPVPPNMHINASSAARGLGLVAINDSDHGVAEELGLTSFVRALYDYQSSDQDLLSFKKGDVIEVITQLDSGWWDGFLHNVRGWFPSNHVEVIGLQEALPVLQYGSSLAAQDSSEAIVDMASVLGTGHPDDWGLDDTAVLRDALAHISPAHSTFPPGISSDEASSATPRAMATQYATPGFGVHHRTSPTELWVRRLANDGMSYFYQHRVTGDVSWTAPDEPSNDARGDRTARPLPRADEMSISSSVSTYAPTEYNMFRSYSTDSGTSQEQEALANDNASAYSDDSDVQPRPRSQERNSITSPLQQSIALAHEAGSIELTTAEEAAQALQLAMVPPGPPTLTELSMLAQNEIERLVDAMHDAEVGEPGDLKTLDLVLAAVVNSIRDLIFVTALPSGTLPDAMNTDRDMRRSNLQEDLKPKQRKVTATLSKLVLSVHALQHDFDVDFAKEWKKIGGDAVELKAAVETFAHEVARSHRHTPLEAKRVHGVFSTDHIGLGLMGSGAAASWKGFGFVPLGDSGGSPEKPLDSAGLKGLKDHIKHVLAPLHEFRSLVNSSSQGTAIQIAGKSRDVIKHFTEFLAFVADFSVARHVDIDGVKCTPEQTTAYELYTKLVRKAQEHVRMLEVAVQAIYDDNALLLTAAQTLHQVDWASPAQAEKQRAASCAHLNTLVKTLETNTETVEQTLEQLLQVGQDQADLAIGDYNGSIGWRLSRVSVIENTLRPLIAPGTTHGLGPGSLANIVHAFGSHKKSKSSIHSLKAASERSNLTHVQESSDIIPAPHGSEPSSSDQEALSDDESLEGPSTTKAPRSNNKAARILGADVTNHVNAPRSETSPTYLMADHSPADIIMDMRDGTVKAGTLPALVERLTSHENPDTKFIKSFLMTWKSFATLDEVVDLLIHRYWLKPPEGLKPAELDRWTKLKQMVVRARVLNMMKAITMDEDDILDVDDYSVLEKMRAFVLNDQVAKVPAAKQTLVWIDRARMGNSSLKRVITHNQTPPPAPILPRSLNKKLKLLDIDPLELARQLTILDSQLLLDIRATRILRSHNQRGEVSSSEQTTEIIRTFNRLSTWVADTVLSNGDSKRRAAATKYFIAVAERCRRLNNFSSMLAIVSGLNNPACSRLKRTWEQVSQRNISQLHECDRLMNSDKNWSTYRNALAKVSPPCIPFFGLYLTQLTFIQDGNPNLIDDKINFSKRHRAAEVIHEIKRWQTRPYNLQPVTGILSFIEESLNAYPDPDKLKDGLYSLSLELEPREREDEKMTRMLTESGVII